MRLHITVGLLLLSIAGCGTQVSGKTTLAEARRACEEYEPISDNEWDAAVILYSEASNAGGTKGEFLAPIPGYCAGDTETEAMESACIVCFTKLAHATW